MNNNTNDFDNNEADINENDLQNDDLLVDDDFEENEAQNKNKKEKQPLTIRGIVRYAIIAIAAIAFCYSSFMLIKIYLGYKQGTDIYKSINNSVLTPVEKKSVSENGDNIEEDLPFMYNHKALLEINSEGIGYLYVPSINLQLPLVQGSDNDYYLTHTFNRTYNGAGALFEDSRIEKGLDATNVIIYGHNMKNGSMFAGLNKYLTPSFYTPHNDVFYIYTGNVVRQYKIFSAYISESISSTYTYNFSSMDSLRAYAAEMKGLSSYNMNVDVSNTTQVITFSTCTSDGDRRIIVHGTFIGETALSE